MMTHLTEIIIVGVNTKRILILVSIRNALGDSVATSLYRSGISALLVRTPCVMSRIELVARDTHEQLRITL